MNKSNLGSVSSSDLIDAKLEQHQLYGSNHCPSCGHKLDRNKEWVGLPAGVKFDPSDQELIEHLEAKVMEMSLKSHPLIDDFIPTIQGEDGICYTHPQKLPGVTRDGLSKHFFHRPSKAYTTGTRKRRKVQTESSDIQGAAGGETRWHKTGKTRPVMLNSKQKGCKKILVLYTNFGKNRKPEKTNWVMHQYHLGQDEEEKEGEFVVSKIFYQTQPRQCNWSDRISPSTTTYLNTRRESGSNSCSSGLAAVFSSYGGLDVTDNPFGGFNPSSKNFDDQVDLGEAEALGGEDIKEQSHRSYDHHMTHDHHQKINSTSAFNISSFKPSHPISFDAQSSLLLDHNSYYLSPIMLRNQSLQEQEQKQHHDKVGSRSTSGLEELIMGCTSNHNKEESNTGEADWLKYSSFWPEPDNQDKL